MSSAGVELMKKGSSYYFDFKIFSDNIASIFFVKLSEKERQQYSKIEQAN